MSNNQTNFNTIIKELGGKNLTTVYMPELPEHKRIAVFVLNTLGFEKYQESGQPVVDSLISLVGSFNSQYESNSFPDNPACCMAMSEILKLTFAQLEVDPTEDNMTACLTALLPDHKAMFLHWL